MIEVYYNPDTNNISIDPTFGKSKDKYRIYPNDLFLTMQRKKRVTLNVNDFISRTDVNGITYLFICKHQLKTFLKENQIELRKSQHKHKDMFFEDNPLNEIMLKRGNIYYDEDTEETVVVSLPGLNVESGSIIRVNGFSCHIPEDHIVIKKILNDNIYPQEDWTKKEENYTIQKIMLRFE